MLRENIKVCLSGPELRPAFCTNRRAWQESNKEATSKAGDRSSYIRLFDRGRQLPPLFPCANRLQFKSYYNRHVHTARFCSHEIEHTG